MQSVKDKELFPTINCSYFSYFSAKHMLWVFTRSTSLYLFVEKLKKYRIRPNYRTVRLDFSKLLNKLLVKYQPNRGTFLKKVQQRT